MQATVKKRRVKRGPRKTKRQQRISASPDEAGIFQRDQPLLQNVEWSQARLRDLQGRPGYYDQLTVTLQDGCQRIVAMLGSQDPGVQITAINALIKFEGLRVRQEEAQITYAKGAFEALTLVELGHLQAKVDAEGLDPRSVAPKVLDDVLETARAKLGARKGVPPAASVPPA